MIKISNIETYGWEAAIRGMRNPMNSWHLSDSDFKELKLGEKDLKLAYKLSELGPVHSKYLRMITVTMDIEAPLYWWKEFDTYKVGTVANSCSTMHKIQAKEFTLDDFSIEHLTEGNKEGFKLVLNCLNTARQNFVETKDKIWWWQMIQVLPSSYNQKRTVQMNYEVLKNIYMNRLNHKLDEWRTLCKTIEMLPNSSLIIGEQKND